MAVPANLSVIVTNYNKTPEQLMECMQSIREQTVRPKEVILVDDCSADPRAHALATSIVLPKNVGVAKARDIGVRMSTGKLLLFVDADDKLAPDFIQQCGRVIMHCDIAYTNLLLFGNVEHNTLVDTPKELTPERIFPATCLIRVSSMMYREVYDTLGGFRDLPVYEDWDFWIRAMCQGYTFKKANTLLWYRQIGGSRNGISSDIKSATLKEIVAPYIIEGGKLKKKEDDGNF